MTLTFWILFNLFVVAMLFADLFLIHGKDKVIKVREALLWTSFWVSLAMLFNVLVYYWKGYDAALQFLAGYLVEEALSIDNLFVFLMIFSFFKVPSEYQYKALFWGIIGTLVLRIIFIIAGVALISKFHWILYIFGFFLIYTGIKMFFQKKEETIDLENNFILKKINKIFRITNRLDSARFFLKENGKIVGTPMLLVLLMLVVIDFLFALDSIPAVIAISQDPFIVYTSNVFAILGLRSLYFALAGAMKAFHLLNYGLSLILVFIGVKLLIQEWYAIDTVAALSVIIGILAATVFLSMVIPKK